jgi:beta-lactamase class D/dienelactone hydrolase
MSLARRWHHTVRLACTTAVLLSGVSGHDVSSRQAPPCTVTVDGRTVGCKLAIPPGAGPHPGVILLHGRAGRPFYSARLDDAAGRLVRGGYAVMTLHYFDATGDREPPPVTRERFDAWRRTVSAAVTAFGERADVEAARIGLAGISLGGFLAVPAVQQDARIAAVAVHSAGLSEFAAPAPARIAPTLVAHAERDPIAPAAGARRLIETLRAAGVAHEFHLYPVEQHVLEDDAWTRAWGSTVAFFDRYLAPGPPRELTELQSLIYAPGLAGTVLVYDAQRRRYAGIHTGRADRALIPASTFKIVSSLLALDAGLVTDAETVLRWDGVTHERTELNGDLTLAQAFRLSAVPHYQALVRRLGAARAQQFLDAFGYGNRDISGGVDQFWLTGALRISPREQIDLLVRLHRGDLPVSGHAMATVRGIMTVEQTPAHIIRAKTGWARVEGGRQVGWWVGWVERGDERYFFASALESERPREGFGPLRESIARTVLQALGALDAPER